MEIEARRMNTILRTFRELYADDQRYVITKLLKIVDDNEANETKEVPR